MTSEDWHVFSSANREHQNVHLMGTQSLTSAAGTSKMLIAKPRCPSEDAGLNAACSSTSIVRLLGMRIDVRLRAISYSFCLTSWA